MIKNITRKKVLANKKIICKSAVEKAVGLMLSRPLKDTGMILAFNKEARREIHMFFVFYPIDVLFLDNGKKVVEVKENFRPFSMHNSRKRAQYVIELPEGTVKRTGTKIGDRVGV